MIASNQKSFENRVDRRVSSAPTAVLDALIRIRSSFVRARKKISGQIKLAAGFASTILLLLGLIVTIVFWQVSARSEANSVLAMGALASADLTASIAETRYHASQYAQTGSEAEIVSAQERLEEAKVRLDETISTSKMSRLGELEKVAWLRAQVEGFELEIRALKQAMNAGNSITVDALAKAININGQLLANYARDYEDDFISEAEAANAAFANFKQWVWIAAFLTVITGVFATLLMARFFVRHFADAIHEMTRAMVDIANGDDAADIPGHERADEIGAMARSLAVFRAKANEVVRLEKDVAEASKRETIRELEQREHAEEQKRAALGRFADRFETDVSGVVGHVATASEQLHDTANEMAQAAVSASDLLARSRAVGGRDHTRHNLGLDGNEPVCPFDRGGRPASSPLCNGRTRRQPSCTVSRCRNRDASRHLS